MRALIATLFTVLLMLGVLVVGSDAGAEEKTKQPDLSCPDQLTMMTALAKEYDQTRDNAVREKVAYKNAYEAQARKIQALEKQLGDLKPKSESIKPDDKKAD